jgi:hypothetical protein
LLGAAPSTAVIETASGSPFGMQLIGGTLQPLAPLDREVTQEQGFGSRSRAHPGKVG